MDSLFTTYEKKMSKEKIIGNDLNSKHILYVKLREQLYVHI